MDSPAPSSSLCETEQKVEVKEVEKEVKKEEAEISTEDKLRQFCSKFVDVDSVCLTINKEKKKFFPPGTCNEINVLTEQYMKSLSFMVIDDTGNELSHLAFFRAIIDENKYPAILIKIDEKKAINNNVLVCYLNHLGYRMVKIDNYFLAHENEKWVKRVQILKAFDEQEKENIKSDFEKGATSYFTYKEWLFLSKEFRLQGENKGCYECAMHAKTCKNIPPDQKHLIDVELSISTYYLGKKEEGYNACERIICDEQAPFGTRNHTMEVLQFYLDPLPLHGAINVVYPIQAGYYQSSSSIIKIDGGFRMNIRAVNYIINRNGDYEMSTGDGIVRTINYIVDMDENFRVLGGFRLHDKSGIPTYPKNILGLEDVRLIDKSNFFCTYLETNEERIPEIVHCKYDDKVYEVNLMRLKPEITSEKNWLPFYRDGKLCFIYGFNPFRLYELVEGKPVEVINRKLSEKYLDFRGSAPPIPFDDGWLCTVHCCYYSKPRKYWHRFMWFDKEFNKIKYSKLFYFEKIGIEFNLSIVEHGEHIVLCYSVNDGSNTIASVETKVVREMLIYS